MLGSSPARACTLSSCAIPWSVSAAWNWTLLLRARFKASCSVSVSGACVELVGCASCAGAIGTMATINSAMRIIDFLADKGDLLLAPTVYVFQKPQIELPPMRQTPPCSRIKIQDMRVRAAHGLLLDVSRD